MAKLRIPKPVSAGVILSYKCTSECRHCMYACSHRWRDDWMSLELFEDVLDRFGQNIEANSPRSGVSMNQGLHFTGGEPFLNYDLLLKAIRLASDYGIHSSFVETNCFWCVDDDIVEERFIRLKNEGLGGVLISVNPFLLEFVPFERMERALKVGHRVFGEDMMAYHPNFYGDLKRLGITGRMKWEDYLAKADDEALSHIADPDVLLPMGRLAWRPNPLYGRFHQERFFHEDCREELTRPWHVHVDNYGNYISGYCGGLSLGGHETWDEISREGIDLDERPVIGALALGLGNLYKYAEGNYAYAPNKDGYISKCHLCLDIRKHLTDEGCELKELSPRQFYDLL